MHLLAAKPGSISDGSAALDLGQAPGDIVFLSSADTELACLAAAQDRLGPDVPSLRLANLLQLGHNLSVDLYLDKVVRHARLVILRLLGGARYWPYGIEQLAALCRESGIEPTLKFLGHGIGQTIHEEPYLTETKDIIFQPNITFTMEPLYMIPGRMGFHVEDMYRMTTPGFTAITGAIAPNDSLIRVG